MRAVGSGLDRRRCDRKAEICARPDRWPDQALTGVDVTERWKAFR